MPRPKGECFEKKAAKPACGCCPTLADQVRQRHVQKTMTCAQAFALADELKVSRTAMGKALDAAGIKVKACQLGCF